ncbi:hypothetical protein [Desulfovibrio cuneatus]|nr:hypothetical protein [Desulfovibrio cuneatus]
MQAWQQMTVPCLFLAEMAWATVVATANETAEEMGTDMGPTPRANNNE